MLAVIKGWFSAALAILVSLGSYGQNHVSPKEMDAIYISHSGWGRAYIEYKIDLKNKTLWMFEPEDWLGKDCVPRDAGAEQEGFDFVRSLEEDNIKTFRGKATRYGFASWRNSYDQSSRFFLIADGVQWGIEIVFADGTKKIIEGSNQWPLTWNCMYDAFEDLTGEDILEYKRSQWV